MPQVTIDDESAKKNRRKRKKDTEEESLDLRKDKDTDPPPAPKTPKDIEAEEKKKKNIKTAILIGVLIMAFFLRGPFLAALKNARSDTSLGADEIEMIDLSGYTEASAISKIEKVGLFAQIERIYDPYCAEGTVVKASAQAHDVVKKGDIILLYICDKSMPIVNADYSDLQPMPPAPYKEPINNIEVVSFDIIGDKFNIVIQNPTDFCITSMNYTIEYSNALRESIGSRKYSVDEIQILPGQKFELEDFINQPDAKFIKVSYFDCKAIPVPENQRQ